MRAHVALVVSALLAIAGAGAGCPPDPSFGARCVDACVDGYECFEGICIPAGTAPSVDAGPDVDAGTDDAGSDDDAGIVDGGPDVDAGDVDAGVVLARRPIAVADTVVFRLPGLGDTRTVRVNLEAIDLDPGATIECEISAPPMDVVIVAVAACSFDLTMGSAVSSGAELTWIARDETGLVSEPAQLFVHPVPFAAYQNEWLGSVNADLTELDNWSAAEVPDADDVVFFPHSTPFDLFVTGGDLTVKGVLIETGALVDMGSSTLHIVGDTTVRSFIGGDLVSGDVVGLTITNADFGGHGPRIEVTGGTGVNVAAPVRATSLLARVPLTLLADVQVTDLLASDTTRYLTNGKRVIVTRDVVLDNGTLTLFNNGELRVLGDLVVSAGIGGTAGTHTVVIEGPGVHLMDAAIAWQHMRIEAATLNEGSATIESSLVVTGTGALEIDASGVLSFDTDAALVLAAGSAMTGAGRVVIAGSVTSAGTYEVTTTELRGVTPWPSAIEMRNVVIDFDAAVNVPDATLVTGDVVVNGSLDVDESSMQINGDLVVSNTGHFIMDGAQATILGNVTIADAANPNDLVAGRITILGDVMTLGPDFAGANRVGAQGFNFSFSRDGGETRLDVVDEIAECTLTTAGRECRLPNVEVSLGATLVLDDDLAFDSLTVSGVLQWDAATTLVVDSLTFGPEALLSNPACPLPLLEQVDVVEPADRQPCTLYYGVCSDVNGTINCP